MILGRRIAIVLWTLLGLNLILSAVGFAFFVVLEERGPALWPSVTALIPTAFGVVLIRFREALWTWRLPPEDVATDAAAVFAAVLLVLATWLLCLGMIELVSVFVAQRPSALMQPAILIPAAGQLGSGAALLYGSWPLAHWWETNRGRRTPTET